jgi:hypothetical protein
MAAAAGRWNQRLPQYPAMDCAPQESVRIMIDSSPARNGDAMMAECALSVRSVQRVWAARPSGNFGVWERLWVVASVCANLASGAAASGKPAGAVDGEESAEIQDLSKEEVQTPSHIPQWHNVSFNQLRSMPSNLPVRQQHCALASRTWERP